MKALNDAHEQEYKKLPEVVAKAPGRFHLIGEHSWFFKDKTLSMAINLPVYVAVSKREDSSLHFYFHQLNDRKKSSSTGVKLKKEDKWANAVKAVVYGFTSGGYAVGGFDLTIYSQILPSAGFGITTAVKVAAALAIKELFGFKCDNNVLLQVLERANKLFLQTANHIADNYAALFSKKDTLLITDHFKNSWDYANFDFPDKKILLVDTKVPRWTVWNEESIYEPQYALLLGDLREKKPNVYGGWQYISDITDINEILEVVSEDIHRKLYTMLREHNDVLEAREGLIKSDFFRFARAVNDSYVTMRDLYDISCPEIDWILKRVGELEPNLEQVRNPVTCGRITGKGFGRCLYAIVRNSDVDTFKAKIAEFEKIFGFHPDVYEVVPSDGASLVRD
ncbi:galactokinase family protein [Treponema sp. C6A8]|uniref:galactokinase n=1 Tax=Treponema sp. C6A8 TaxID=1410609 RepID=UPI00048618B9|nr:galactokinase family protein [Treponema sp. C6A8]